MNKREVLEALGNNNLAPIYKLGQNFLVNEEYINLICSNVNKDDVVLEIGAGLGALTLPLAKRSKKVTAIEIDSGFVRYLTAKTAQINNLEIIHGDFLKTDIDFNQYSKIISNLPYYVTSSIIEKVVINMREGSEFIFMVQKEVSERLEAKENSKKQGVLSILLKTLGKLEKMFLVSKTNFYPEPSVDSLVYKFTKNTNIPFSCSELYDFLHVIFHNRRKTLANNLQNKTNDKEITNEILNKSNLEGSLRAEQLNVEQIMTLFYNAKEIL